MAKRFTDTEKWKKPFIKGLKAPYKLLWFYVCDDCDYAGIWQVDIEVAQIRIGETVNEKSAISFFKEKIVLIENGTKWFIPSFLEFQYPSGLSANNKAHIGIIQTLKKYNLIDENLKAPSKPLGSPLNGAKDMDMVKEMEMEKEMEKEKVKKEKEFISPFSEHFDPVWQTWKNYKSKEFQFKYKSVESEQAAINELVNLSSGNEKIAEQIITQSLTNGWKGFFPLKNLQNGTSKNQQSGSTLREQVANEFNKRFGVGA